jgi:DUF2917 family protein
MDAYRNLVEFAALSSIAVTQKKLGRITDGRGMRLYVETGAVWITEHGKPDDVYLPAGESYCLTQNGLTVVAAVNAPFALITIEPPMAIKPTLGERFWKFWAALYAPASCPTTAAL